MKLTVNYNIFMVEKDPNKISFRGVGLFFIIIGIFLFSVGIAGWIMNYFYQAGCITTPSHKLMGGAVIMALGYVVLLLEFIRKK